MIIVVYTYFVPFYQKIHDILLPKTGIVSAASSLSTTCQSDSNRINLYLGEINDSKWSESGASIFKSNIITGIKSSIQALNLFISNNLVKACSISINSLLPSLKEMKTNDELLFNKREELSSKKSRLCYLQNNIPSQYETDKKGRTHISQAYIDAINAINALAAEINTLTAYIQTLIKLLDGIKASSDGYIMQISTLGDEGIIVPGHSANRDNLVKDLVPLDMNNYPYIDTKAFQGGTFEKWQIDGVGCRIYVPNGYKMTPDTKLTVYLTGSGDRGNYFSELANNSDYSSIKSFPKGPVLVVVTDSFYDKNGFPYSKSNDIKLNNIISQAKSNLNITNDKISIVAYSAGNDVFAKYITGYGNNVDKAVLINPCGNALKHLTNTEFAAPYSNVGEVQIIQADRETKKHIDDNCYKLSQTLAESSNTSIAYFNGDHGDNSAVLSGKYVEPTGVSRQLSNYTASTDAYLDTNFNIWDYV